MSEDLAAFDRIDEPSRSKSADETSNDSGALYAMRLPRDLTGRQLAAGLQRLGYEIVRREGSHIRLRTDQGGRHSITIPDHAPLKVGTLRSILQDVATHHRVARDELLAILFGSGTKSEESTIRRCVLKLLGMTEIVFLVEEDPEGGFVAKAVGRGIFTQADAIEELHEMVRDAVRCHFADEPEAPKLIRLHFVRDEVIAA